MTTSAVEEKQQELDALQTAFDEYIVSSRELEEELDAELTRCQNDLAKAEQCNAALVTQLSNIQPQLNSLEAKVSTLNSQLASESQKRISAEMKSEEYENKLRESEGTISALRSSEMRKLKQENEELCERLAFVEGESEDYRNELNTERERHRIEVEELQSDVSMLRIKLQKREEELELLETTDIGNVLVGEEAANDEKKRGDDASDMLFDEDTAVVNETEKRQTKSPPPTATITHTAAPSTSDMMTTKDEREEYIRTLEDELELVTEQLIEAETKLSRTQAELEDAFLLIEEQQQQQKQKQLNSESEVPSGKHGVMNGVLPTSTSSETTLASDKICELELSIQRLQDEHATLHDESKRLREELDLALEELALSKEEIEALEEDKNQQSIQFDAERRQLKDDLAAIQTQLNEAISHERCREIESKSWEEALLASKKETQALVEEVEKLEAALQNSKADYEAIQEEMEELKLAFDKTASRERDESHGQYKALEDLLTARTWEVLKLHEEVTNLTETNASLNKILEQTADSLDKQDMEMTANRQAHVEASSSLVSSSTSQELQDAQDKIHSLEGVLEAVRKELDEQRNELDTVRSSLQEKIVHVQTDLTIAEEELARTKTKMVEVENERLNNQSLHAADVKTKLSLLSWIPHPFPQLQSGIEDETYSHVSDFRRSHALSRPIYSHYSRSRPRSCSPTTIQRLVGDSNQRAASESSLKMECNRLQDQNRMSVSMKNHLENEIKQLQKMLLDANGDKLSGSNTYEEEKSSMDNLTCVDDTNIDDILQSNDSEAIAKEVRSMAKKIAAQKSHNAELLTRILKLQGNIQVCCRIRPMSVEESQQGLHEVAQSLSETDVACFDERTRLWKSYAFDKVWGPESTQKDVFQDVEPMVLSVIDGYNACIFAYGQTGSGKTFTMEGSKSNGQYGISQRTIQRIFSLLQDKTEQHRRTELEKNSEVSSLSPPFEYNIEVSMLEIYNDEVYDLLDPDFSKSSGGTPRNGTPRKKALEIRHSADNTIEVPGLMKENVGTVSQVLDALDRGNSNRATASTNLNEHSSRSHMILRVEVSSGVGATKNTGSLYLIDLAGSERVRKSEVQGQSLKEAQHINKSLSALGNVMEALDRKSSHIPYRDSKLTHLLQNSLGGNSRTMMVVTVCPHNNSYDETTFALKFATRVRRINLGSAQKNVLSKNLEETVKNLTSEMSLLSKAKERSESQLLSLKREKERVEDKLSKASLSRTKSQEETRTLSVLRQNLDDITSRWNKERTVREEKAAELGKVQEEMQRVQNDLKSLKREQESLHKQNEDKENTIFKLKNELRSMKEQLNNEKIRLRRSQVMQSRIPVPAPPYRTRNVTASARLKSSGSLKSLSTVNSVARNIGQSTATLDQTKLDIHGVARIRYRVLKILEEYDPAKVEKIDIVMAKFEGRENELLEKMIARYESSAREESTSIASSAEASQSNQSSAGSRPKSRQDMSLERHLERMKRIRASANKDGNN